MYKVKFKYYQYNSGRGDNGSFGTNDADIDIYSVTERKLS